MVLQIREKMVLQGVELEGKGSPPFFGFRPVSGHDGEAWFRSKTSSKVEMVT